MKRKDYILIANTLNKLNKNNKVTDKNKDYILNLANQLSIEFKRDNKRFRPDKFIELIK